MLQGSVGGEKFLVQPRELPVWTHSPVVDVATKEDDAEVIGLLLTGAASILTVVAPVILHSTTEPRIRDNFTLVSCQGDGRAFGGLVRPGQDILRQMRLRGASSFHPAILAPWSRPIIGAGSKALGRTAASTPLVKRSSKPPANDMISPCFLYPTI